MCVFARGNGGAMTAALVVAAVLFYFVVLAVSAFTRAVDRVNRDLAVLAELRASADSTETNCSHDVPCLSDG
ncbi:hypothetical protein K7640_28230 [Micromonospora sp. PLK6-60]|uniref:hypothetical protein n=1 Tax=Micromonospora sp. PLK6-60 TaxID=2873383 RepID=UPI001CA61122|nr:hypothetical protein [Micromonospora sp. PLK6-60]MBY8875723.1 hypothetical protein [Micromonospora sp. PLK6-60]